jgi:hypothetical protein
MLPYLPPILSSLISLLSRLTSTPNSLQEPIPLRQPVQTIISFGSGSHKSAQRVHLVLARVAAGLVDFADADLHAGVIFGFDDAVRGAAFAGDVAVREGC